MIFAIWTRGVPIGTNVLGVSGIGWAVNLKNAARDGKVFRVVCAIAFWYNMRRYNGKQNKEGFNHATTVRLLWPDNLDLLGRGQEQAQRASHTRRVCGEDELMGAWALAVRHLHPAKIRGLDK